MMKVTTALTWSRIPTTQVQNRLLVTIPARISFPTGEELKFFNETASQDTDVTQLISFPFNIGNHTPQLSNDYHVLDVLILLTLLIFLFYIIAKFASKKIFINTTEITLELINRTDRITLKLGRIPHRSQYYTFKATAFVEEVNISGGLILKFA